MRQKTSYKRKQYIVSAKFQMRYVGLILMLVFLTGILCSYVVYYTSMIVMGDKLANVYPQGRLMSIVNMVNIRILLSLLLVTPFVVMIGIYASHKIAGPIYRIERYLNSMAAGDHLEPLTLRKNDELVMLADGINRVSESIRSGAASQREKLAKAAASLDGIKKAVASRSGDHAQLEKLVSALGDQLADMKKDTAK
jgi:methyl-accepting chemotaxis protein